MSASPQSLAGRVARSQLAAIAATAAVAIPLAPRLLLLDEPTTAAATTVALRLIGLVAVAAALSGARRVSRTRWARRAIALGSSAIEPADIVALSRLPFWVALDTVAVASLALGLGFAPGLRPHAIDAHDALGTTLVGLAFVGTAALPLYAALRRHVGRVLELVDPDVVRDAISSPETTRRAWAWLARRIALAVAAPVALVTVSTAVVARAHVHTLDEQSRVETARTLAEIVLFRGTGALASAGAEDARAAASAHGFAVQRAGSDARFALRPQRDGRVAMTLLVASSAAVVRFVATELPVLSWAELAVAVSVVAIALAFGTRLGGALARDLAAATRRIRRLGTASVVAGSIAPVRAPSYDEVGELAAAIDGLAARFQVFAAAQERALAARETARSTRALLFASVSHDLRTPLAAILGFTDLVAMSPLTEPQRESLDVVRERARELFALVETVLDVSRIEAGELAIARRAGPVEPMLRAAVDRVHPPDSATPAPVQIDCSDAPALARVDPSRVSQAVAALLRHALRDSRRASNSAHELVRIVASAADDGLALDVAVAYGGGTIPPHELARLVGPDPWMPSRRRFGGFTLGLALARSIAELHGGSLRAEAHAPDRTRLVLSLPFASRGRASASPRAAPR